MVLVSKSAEYYGINLKCLFCVCHGCQCLGLNYIGKDGILDTGFESDLEDEGLLYVMD